MSTTDLGGPLLASVSRSFYLSIRVLPAAVRAPVAVAYLLARASDTIADSEQAEPALRIAHLAAFRRMVLTGESHGLQALKTDITSAHPGERNLLANLEGCLAWLLSLNPTDRAEVLRVMEKIIDGQALDLERFGNAASITALANAAELDSYTYLVAGCVGEFWTRICLSHVHAYSSLPEDALLEAGKCFGEGLQLINILRDLPADLRNGRCYLPQDELAAIGVEPATLLSEPQRARPVVDRWLQKAEEHLDQGRLYIQAVGSGRLRVACFLPWYLGIKTLELMRRTPPLEATGKVKVPRSTVRRALALALPVALSRRAVDKMHSRLAGI